MLCVLRCLCLCLLVYVCVVFVVLCGLLWLGVFCFRFVDSLMCFVSVCPVLCGVGCGLCCCCVVCCL